MKKLLLVFVLMLMGSGALLNAQISHEEKDTIYFEVINQDPITFSKGLGKFIFLKNIIPEGVPEKKREIRLVAANGDVIDEKLFQVIDNRHILIPMELFKSKIYNIYVVSGNYVKSSHKIFLK